MKDTNPCGEKLVYCESPGYVTFRISFGLQLHVDDAINVRDQLSEAITSAVQAMQRCKFCQSAVRKVERIGKAKCCWAVICCDCGAQGPIADTEEEARSKWGIA